MYKYYNKNNFRVMEYTFDSIHEFIDYLDKTPVNTEIWYPNKLESKNGNYDFCKTQSLSQAKEFCKYGYHEDFERLVELKYTLERYIKLSKKKNRQYNYYARNANSYNTSSTRYNAAKYPLAQKTT